MNQVNGRGGFAGNAADAAIGHIVIKPFAGKVSAGYCLNENGTK